MDGSNIALGRLAGLGVTTANDVICVGLVAEDVAEVSPGLVVRDKAGELLTVRYDQINAMLLNEFLKEHQKVQHQQKEIASLEEELKEPRDLIRNVDAKVERMSLLGTLTKAGRY